MLKCSFIHNPYILLKQNSWFLSISTTLPLSPFPQVGHAFLLRQCHSYVQVGSRSCAACHWSFCRSFGKEAWWLVELLVGGWSHVVGGWCCFRGLLMIWWLVCGLLMRVAVWYWLVVTCCLWLVIGAVGVTGWCWLLLMAGGCSLWWLIDSPRGFCNFYGAQVADSAFLSCCEPRQIEGFPFDDRTFGVDFLEVGTNLVNVLAHGTLGIHICERILCTVLLTCLKTTSYRIKPWCMLLLVLQLQNLKKSFESPSHVSVLRLPGINAAWSRVRLLKSGDRTRRTVDWCPH